MSSCVNLLLSSKDASYPLPFGRGFFFIGSLSTVVGDEKLTSREDRIGPLFMYVQSDEDTLLKVDEVSETKS